MDEKQRYRRQMPVGGKMEFFQSGRDDVTIRYATWPAKVEASKGTFIVLPGRTEFIEKYYEVVNELLERGYAVAAMDWRGQGLSTRPLENREKHYFKDFATALPDLEQCITDHLRPRMSGPFHILAHSMGGHLSLRFLHDYPDLIGKAVMTAPMAGINFGGIPKWMAAALSTSMCALGLEESYLAGNDDYKDGRWGWREKLTSDLERFEDEDYFIKIDRNLALGGITYGWLKAALSSIKTLHSTGYAEAIKTPTLIVQAGGDEIVDNAMVTSLAARLPNGQLRLVQGAMHEILKEQDHYRVQFWAAFDDFMT